MLCGAHLHARSLVKAITPPLLAWYPIACSSADDPPNPATDAMLMILPDLCASMVLPTAWQNRNVPVKLVEMTLCHCSNVMSSTGAAHDTPALLTRMSIRPNLSSVAFTTS